MHNKKLTIKKQHTIHFNFYLDPIIEFLRSYGNRNEAKGDCMCVFNNKKLLNLDSSSLKSSSHELADFL